MHLQFVSINKKEQVFATLHSTDIHALKHSSGGLSPLVLILEFTSSVLAGALTDISHTPDELGLHVFGPDLVFILNSIRILDLLLAAFAVEETIFNSVCVPEHLELQVGLVLVAFQDLAIELDACLSLRGELNDVLLLDNLVVLLVEASMTIDVAVHRIFDSMNHGCCIFLGSFELVGTKSVLISLTVTKRGSYDDETVVRMDTAAEVKGKHTRPFFPLCFRTHNISNVDLHLDHEAFEQVL